MWCFYLHIAEDIDNFFGTSGFVGFVDIDIAQGVGSVHLHSAVDTDPAYDGSRSDQMILCITDRLMITRVHSLFTIVFGHPTKNKLKTKHVCSIE